MDRNSAFVYGDHSSLHSGSDATWINLEKTLRHEGFTIVMEPEFADVIIINGEGSMHHNSTPFRKKMESAQKYVDSKPVILTNSVWQANSAKYDDVLRKMSSVEVRDPLSQKDLLSRHAFLAEVRFDLAARESYEHYSSRLGLRMSHSKHGAQTDFFDKDARAWRYHPLIDLPRLDMGAGWHNVLRMVAETKYVFAGRYHAAVACVMTATPCYAVRSNSHKIEGLRDSLPHPDQIRLLSFGDLTKIEPQMIEVFDESKLLENAQHVFVQAWRQRNWARYL